MNAAANHETALRDYLDALLESSPTPAPADAGDTRWWLCVLGRLQLLLPAVAFEPAIDCAELPQAPAEWHFTRLPIGATDRRVIELARVIAPGMAPPPVDTLLPIAGSEWMLAVSGPPQPLSLPADAIQWRAHRSSRMWLAGMSCDARYMALDVHELIAEAAGNAAAAAEESPS